MPLRRELLHAGVESRHRDRCLADGCRQGQPRPRGSAAEIDRDQGGAIQFVRTADVRIVVLGLGDTLLVGPARTPVTVTGFVDDTAYLLQGSIWVNLTTWRTVQDANRPDSQHDFGKNIIPSIIDTHRVMAYPFLDENRKGSAYWRDVGTVDAYWEANTELAKVVPALNLYDHSWPIWTHQEPCSCCAD